MEPTGQPERIFHTGRNARTLFIVAWGVLFVLFGGLALGAMLQRGESGARALTVYNVIAGSLLILVGLTAVVISLMAFSRSAVSVYREGVLIRDWRGRSTSVPWSDLEGMVVHYQLVASPYGSSQVATLHLVLRYPVGQSARLKVARLGSDAARDEITSTLAARADLAYAGETQLGRSAVEEVWRKGSDSGARWTAGPQQRGRD